MARHQKPDPLQQDYERQKAAGFPQLVPATPPQVPATSPQAAARPVASVSPRKLIVGGLVVVLVIVAAIVGHAIASSNSIAVGDCAVTNPESADRVGHQEGRLQLKPGPGAGGAKGRVRAGQLQLPVRLRLTIFQDDPASKTYCLNDYSFGGG